MKKILLDQSKNYYKANLHCHSTKSDGSMSVEEIKEHFKKNGYSIVAFTDHEHIIDNSYLNDSEFLAITSCEIAIKQSMGKSTLNNKTMKVCHLNLYAKDSSNVDTPCYNSTYDHFINDSIKEEIVHSCGEYERIYSKEGISDIIKTANEKGFLVSYNHPRWSLENATDYLGYEGLWAVEIYNNECFFSGLYEYDINVYDDFLRSGQKIACTATDDCHSLITACGGFVMINAEKLNYGEIMNALENHNFYASTGPLIKNLYLEDDMAYITIEKGKEVTLSTAGRRSDRKEVQNEGEEETISFKIFPEDIYVRFDVIDKYGKRANTNAYFLN